jgi:hypothetical protein
MTFQLPPPPETRVRAGAPETVDLSPEQWAIYLNPTPIQWLAPLRALLVPVTINTADLCATPPPEKETWDINDLVGSYLPNSQAMIFAKLRRMAEAAIWPTYCEYAPAAQTFIPSGPVTWLGWERGDYDFGSGSGDNLLQMQHPNPTFWILVLQCTKDATTGMPPLLCVSDGQGHYAAPIRNPMPTTSDGVIVQAFNRQTAFPFLVEPMQSGYMPAGWNYWAELYRGETDGRWTYEISGYQVGDPAWDSAPATPGTGQFSAQAVADLTAMGRQWPSDMRVESTSTVSGDGELFVTGIVGIGVDLREYPASLGHLDGTPARIFDVGFISAGTPQQWLAHQRIQHEHQVWLPFGPGVLTRIGYSLAPGVTAAISTLIRW